MNTRSHLMLLTSALCLIWTAPIAAADVSAALMTCWGDGSKHKACGDELAAFAALSEARQDDVIHLFLGSEVAPVQVLGVMLSSKRRKPVQDLPLLERALSSSSPVAASVALAHVHTFGQEIHVQPVLALAEAAATPRVRADALRLLVKMAPDKALEAARAGIRSPSSHVQSASAHVLGRVKDQASVDGLAAIMLDPRKTASVRIQAVKALAAIGAKDTAGLMFLTLGWPNVALQRQLLKGIGKIAHARLATFLVDRLDHSALRRDTLIALSELRSEDVTPRLLGLLGDRRVKEEELRLLFWTMGRIGDRRALPALITQLDGTDPARARLAAEAIGVIGAKQSIRPLVQRLDHSDQTVVEMIHWALVKMTDQPLSPDKARWEAWLADNPF
jgi:HEAT repeat protein